MSRKKARRLAAEINVVPYIDVMLVLLIIFMVAAPMLMQGVKVDLPQAPSTPVDSKQEEPLIVSVKDDGSYYLNLGDKPDSSVALGLLIEKVGKVLRRKPETQVLVWGDQNVPYGVVVSLMTQLQSVGVAGVGLVTESPK